MIMSGSGCDVDRRTRTGGATILLKRMLGSPSYVLPLVLILVVAKKLISILQRPSGRVRAKLAKDLRTYSFVGNTSNIPAFLQEVDPDEITKGGVVSIDHAHRHGLMHMGAVVLVSDVRGDVLLLKRGSHLATCPNSWGVLGEHSVSDEGPLDNAKRGVSEELGRDALDAVSSFNKLTEYPVYMDREFGNNGAADRQLLYMWEARMDKTKENIRLGLDEEVADHQWISLSEYLDWIDRDLKKSESASRDFCCDIVAKIRQFEAERLRAYRLSKSGR
mmetsp:Transcript_18127/g.51886  ORF Transcript_18127/g.51886 Transcript_18127/m.51886 type:complete len:276 (-) Transcript_18127:130-957(-)